MPNYLLSTHSGPWVADRIRQSMRLEVQHENVPTAVWVAKVRVLFRQSTLGVSPVKVSNHHRDMGNNLMLESLWCSFYIIVLYDRF